MERHYGGFPASELRERIHGALAGRGITPEGLLRALPVHDPQGAVTEPEAVAWLPLEVTNTYRALCQFEVDDGHIGAPLPVPPSRVVPSAMHTTARYLWKYQGRWDKQAAVLVAASLYKRISDGQAAQEAGTARPDLTPHRVALARYAAHTVGYASVRYMWAGRGHALARLNRWGRPASREANMAEQVDSIADEVADVFAVSSPVVLEASAERDAGLEPLIEHARPLREKTRRDRSDAAASRSAYLMRHPFANDWEVLAPDDLQRWVNALPVQDLGRLFGVTRQTLGHRARVMGVSIPGSQFWASSAGRYRRDATLAVLGRTSVDRVINPLGVRHGKLTIPARVRPVKRPTIAGNHPHTHPTTEQETA